MKNIPIAFLSLINNYAQTYDDINMHIDNVSHNNNNDVCCTDQVIGCGDVDKRKVGGQEVNIVAVYGSDVLRCT